MADAVHTAAAFFSPSTGTVHRVALCDHRWLMKTPIDHFCATRSIHACFGARRIMERARRSGRQPDHKPVDLSRVIPASGSLPFDPVPYE